MAACARGLFYFAPRTEKSVATYRQMAAFVVASLSQFYDSNQLGPKISPREVGRLFKSFRMQRLLGELAPLAGDQRTATRIRFHICHPSFFVNATKGSNVAESPQP